MSFGATTLLLTAEQVASSSGNAYIATLNALPVLVCMNALTPILTPGEISTGGAIPMVGVGI